MATYCTAQDVAEICNFLGVHGTKRAVWGEDPKLPTPEEVDGFVEISEEWINDECRTGWGSLHLTITEELKDIHIDYAETSIRLNYTNVMTLSSGDGDKLEIWDGQSWTDWLIGYTEGRNDDYFVDYGMGKIYLLRGYYRRERLNARVTYRVQKSATVPKPVKAACALVAGMHILNSDYASVAFPEGQSEEISIRDIMDNWWKLVLMHLRPYLKSGLFTGSPFEPVK